MRKILFLFCTLALFISCSDDDSPEVNTNGTRLVKSVFVDNSGTIITSDFFYNGNQLFKLVSGGSTNFFNYSGSFLIQTTNGVGAIATYEYDGQNRLIHSLGGGMSTVYQYNQDGTITATTYEGDELPENIESVGTLFFDGGELVKKVMTSPTEPDTITYHFSYDDKNNPIINREGYYGAYFYSSWGPYVIGKTHNLLSVSCESTGGPEYSYSYSYDYVYNSFGYPTTQTQIDANGNATSAVVYYYYE